MKISRSSFFALIFLIYWLPGSYILAIMLHGIFTTPVLSYLPMVIITVLSMLVLSLGTPIITLFLYWWITLPYYAVAYGTLYLLVKKGKLEIEI